MADLSWFPYDADQWERRVREVGLSLLEEGALMRLLRHAWRADQPCTILDRPDELARIIGHEAKKAIPVLRAHFTPLADEPGRLRCEWLYDLYLRQLEKHLSYSTRGKKGGRPPRGGKSSGNGSGAQLEAELSGNAPTGKAEVPALSRESSAEGSSCAPTEHTATTPASDDALAPVGAARAAATSEGLAGFGDAWRAVMQGQSVAPPAPGALEAKQTADRERRYFALLASEAAAWMALHRDDAKALDREQRALLNLPEAGDLLLADRRKLRDAVLEEIRERMDWPTTEEWDESDALTAQTPTGATP